MQYQHFLAMKQYLLIGCTLLFSYILSAQSTKWGIGLAVGTPHYDLELENIENRNEEEGDFKSQSINYSVSLNYHSDTFNQWRIRAGIIDIDQRTEILDYSYTSEQIAYKRSHNASQLKKYVAIGFLKSRVNNKLKISAGIELPFILNGEFEEQRTAEYHYRTDGTLIAGYDNLYRQDQGFSFGLTGLLGVRYHLIPQLQLGLEVQSSWLRHVVRDGEFYAYQANDPEPESSTNFNLSEKETITGLMLEIQYLF